MTRFERLTTCGIVALSALSIFAGTAWPNDKPPEKPAAAAPKPVEKTPAIATQQTVKAIAALGDKFAWGITTDEAMRAGVAGIEGWFGERMKNEKNQFRLTAFKKGMADELSKFRASFVKFDGQRSGWDVSVIDSQFTHQNNEAMMELRGIDERRFLFFWNDRLWRQVIVYDRENLAFAGKPFDDFADAMMKRFGPAGVFHKVNDSEEQTTNHIEWPLVGDSELRGLDLMTYHGSYCLSLSQRSKVAAIDASRKSVLQSRALAAGSGQKSDTVAAESTAKPEVSTTAGAISAPAAGDQKGATGAKGAKATKKDKDKPKPKDKEEEDDTVVDPNLDPLQGVDL